MMMDLAVKKEWVRKRKDRQSKSTCVLRDDGEYADESASSCRRSHDHHQLTSQPREMRVPAAEEHRT